MVVAGTVVSRLGSGDRCRGTREGCRRRWRAAARTSDCGKGRGECRHGQERLGSHRAMIAGLAGPRMATRRDRLVAAHIFDIVLALQLLLGTAGFGRNALFYSLVFLHALAALAGFGSIGFAGTYAANAYLPDDRPQGAGSQPASAPAQPASAPAQHADTAQHRPGRDRRAGAGSPVAAGPAQPR